MQGVLVLMLSQVIVKVMGIIYKLYITNKEGFGDKGNAIYAAGFQIYALLLTLSSIGVPNAISKLVSEKLAIGDNRGAYRIFKIAIAIFSLLGFFGSSVLFWGAETIATHYLQIPEAKMTLLLLSPSIFLVSIASVLKGYFNGRENISVTANSQSIEQLVKTILTIGIVEILAGLTSNSTMLMAAGATMATTLATMFSSFYLYIYYIKRMKVVWREVKSSKIHANEGIKKIIKNILVVSVPITLSGLLAVFTKSIDTFTVVRILKNFIGEHEATLQYGILSGKIDTLMSLPYSLNAAFATALVPAVSSCIAGKKIKLAKKRIEFSVMTTVLIGLPFTMIMFLFAKPLLESLFPNAAGGAEMLSLSAIGIIFVVLTQTITGSLQGFGKVTVPVFALGAGFVSKLILNLVLIPIEEIGINGAIISSIICHIVSFIICFMSLRNTIGIRFEFLKFVVKPVIAVINMAICSYYIYNIFITNLLAGEIISFLVSMILGGIIYFLSIILLKILDTEEIFMIPYGQKLYKILIKAKIYKERQTQ